MNETLTLRPHLSHPRARIRVLAGMDGHPYEVVVPLRLKTVEAALDWLRPPGVPADALRQGEFYFVPVAPPGQQYCTIRHEDGLHRHPECYGEETTTAGSEYQWHFAPGAQFSSSHHAALSVAVTKSGSVMFRGRRRLRSHKFVARPQYYVRDRIDHAEHGELVLPRHAQGAWYEVVPNRAHGSFPVRGFGPGD